MAPSRYDTWAMRLDQAIRARGEQLVAPGDITTNELLLALAEEAMAVVGAIGRNIEAVEVSGNHRHGSLPEFLREMMPHGEFSLLEYRYTLPTGQQPGVRFASTVGPPATVALHWYDDTRRWRSDPSSRNVFATPVVFALDPAGIRAHPSAEHAPAFAACTDWQSAVREALALPFRHLYDPAATPS